MRQHAGLTWVALIVSTCLAGCSVDDDKKPPSQRVAHTEQAFGAASAATLKAVDLSDAVRPIVLPGPLDLAAARNEWTSFVLQVADRVPAAAYTLRLNAPALLDSTRVIDPAAFEVYQVLSMPVDVNRAGYARHTGLRTSPSELPRALIPLPSSAGVIDISSLRDPTRPTDPAATAPAADPALLWVDLHVPPDAPAGAFAASVEVLCDGVVVASVPLNLTVYDFALPVERHLQIVGRIRWEDLERLYPDRFGSVRPHLMNRTDPRYAEAVRTIDALLALAHRHRAAAVVPRLHPTVKWPPITMPEVDWTDFDSLTAPWLSGQAFDDRMPVGFWPLPAPAFLAQYDRDSRLQYWSLAATHFDQNDWLDQSPIWVEKVTPGRVTEAESAALSASAAETLAIHSRVRIVVPLETDQLHLEEGPGGAAADAPDSDAPAAGAPGADAPADNNNHKLRRIDPASVTRLFAAAPGLVFAPTMRLWPEDVDRPRRYLRTDMPALVPYVGAGGDERDVRLWAWLAYLRDAELIHWNATLPSLSDPTEAADPNELTWFYPGDWFGLDQPVPTVQLKWLRRAQQDYEYLWLARRHGDRDVRVNALLMARLISKPVEIQPGQNPDPAYALMSGTTAQESWAQAQRLLADMIAMHASGAPIDPVSKHATEIQMLRWAEPQERPLLMGRTTEWFIAPPVPGDGDGDGDAAAERPRLHLRFGVDLYNASDVTGVDDLLAWSAAPPGWEVAPQPSIIPSRATYKIQRAVLDAKFDPAQVTPAARQPVELTFTNGFNTDRQTALRVVLPVANSDRREDDRISIDGIIGDDWDDADLLQDGPLVRMLNRPGLQRHALEFADVPSRVYTSWAGGYFYVAFNLAGINPAGAGAAGRAAQNFVDYQFRRAWGEDLCELLIQPVSAAGVPGPVLHVVCKPNGSSWVERKLPPGLDPAAAPRSAWQEVQARILYASRPAGEAWRGEVKIPWSAILNAAAAAQPDPRNPDAPDGSPAADDAQAGAQPDASHYAPADSDPPALLRFNFVQHRTTTGESASWCGPVDFGRDDALMGALILRDPEDPGIPNLAGNRDAGVSPAMEQR